MFHFVKLAASKLSAGLDKARGKVAAFIGVGAAVAASVFSPEANAASLDTSALSDITASMNTAASWVSGPLTSAIVALVAAAIILAIIKWAGRKARPSG